MSKNIKSWSTDRLREETVRTRAAAEQDDPDAARRMRDLDAEAWRRHNGQG